MSAFRRAVLSVNPDRLEQFTNQMKKNISDKNDKKVSKRHRSPSETSSRRSKTKKRNSKSAKVVAKSSSRAIEGSKSKEVKPSKSAKNDSKNRHKPKSDSVNKKSKEECDFNEKDLDLSNPLYSLTTLVKDRDVLLETAFYILQGSKLAAMVPDNLKRMSLDELKRQCEEHLKVMSSKRLSHVLSGTSMESSSESSSSSDDERPKKVEKQQDLLMQDHTLQTNLVDSTTSDNTGPSMLFPSAISTAQGSIHDKDASPPKSIGFDDFPTSTSPTGSRMTKKRRSAKKSEVEDGELDFLVSDGEDCEIVDIAKQVSQAKDSPVIIDEVFVEEVEEIEETTEDQIHEDTQEREFQTPDNRDETMLQSNPAPKDTLISEDYSGKTQLEILELELRARAIQSLMKATKAGSIKNAPK